MVVFFTVGDLTRASSSVRLRTLDEEKLCHAHHVAMEAWSGRNCGRSVVPMPPPPEPVPVPAPPPPPPTQPFAMGLPPAKVAMVSPQEVVAQLQGPLHDSVTLKVAWDLIRKLLS